MIGVDHPVRGDGHRAAVGADLLHLGAVGQRGSPAELHLLVHGAGGTGQAVARHRAAGAGVRVHPVLLTVCADLDVLHRRALEQGSRLGVAGVRELLHPLVERLVDRDLRLVLHLGGERQLEHQHGLDRLEAAVRALADIGRVVVVEAEHLDDLAAAQALGVLRVRDAAADRGLRAVLLGEQVLGPAVGDHLAQPRLRRVVRGLHQRVVGDDEALHLVVGQHARIVGLDGVVDREVMRQLQLRLGIVVELAQRGDRSTLTAVPVEGLDRLVDALLAQHRILLELGLDQPGRVALERLALHGALEVVVLALACLKPRRALVGILAVEHPVDVALRHLLAALGLDQSLDQGVVRRVVGDAIARAVLAPLRRLGGQEVLAVLRGLGRHALGGVGRRGRLGPVALRLIVLRRPMEGRVCGLALGGERLDRVAHLLVRVAGEPLQQRLGVAVHQVEQLADLGALGLLAARARDRAPHRVLGLGRVEHGGDLLRITGGERLGLRRIERRSERLTRGAGPQGLVGQRDLAACGGWRWIVVVARGRAAAAGRRGRGLVGPVRARPTGRVFVGRGAALLDDLVELGVRVVRHVLDVGPRVGLERVGVSRRPWRLLERRAALDRGVARRDLLGHADRVAGELRVEDRVVAAAGVGVAPLLVLRELVCDLVGLLLLAPLLLRLGRFLGLHDAIQRVRALRDLHLQLVERGLIDRLQLAGLLDRGGETLLVCLGELVARDAGQRVDRLLRVGERLVGVQRVIERLGRGLVVLPRHLPVRRLGGGERVPRAEGRLVGLFRLSAVGLGGVGVGEHLLAGLVGVGELVLGVLQLVGTHVRHARAADVDRRVLRGVDEQLLEQPEAVALAVRPLLPGLDRQHLAGRRLDHAVGVLQREVLQRARLVHRVAVLDRGERLAHLRLAEHLAHAHHADALHHPADGALEHVADELPVALRPGLFAREQGVQEAVDAGLDELAHHLLDEPGHLAARGEGGGELAPKALAERRELVAHARGERADHRRGEVHRALFHAEPAALDHRLDAGGGERDHQVRDDRGRAALQARDDRAHHRAEDLDGRRRVVRHRVADRAVVLQVHLEPLGALDELLLVSDEVPFLVEHGVHRRHVVLDERAVGVRAHQLERVHERVDQAVQEAAALEVVAHPRALEVLLGGLRRPHQRQLQLEALDAAEVALDPVVERLPVGADLLEAVADPRELFGVARDVVDDPLDPLLVGAPALHRVDQLDLGVDGPLVGELLEHHLLGGVREAGRVELLVDHPIERGLAVLRLVGASLLAVTLIERSLDALEVVGGAAAAPLGRRLERVLHQLLVGAPARRGVAQPVHVGGDLVAAELGVDDPVVVTRPELAGEVVRDVAAERRAGVGEVLVVVALGLLDLLGRELVELSHELFFVGAPAAELPPLPAAVHELLHLGGGDVRRVREREPGVGVDLHVGVDQQRVVVAEVALEQGDELGAVGARDQRGALLGAQALEGRHDLVFVFGPRRRRERHQPEVVAEPVHTRVRAHQLQRDVEVLLLGADVVGAEHRGLEAVPQAPAAHVLLHLGL